MPHTEQEDNGAEHSVGERGSPFKYSVDDLLLMLRNRTQVLRGLGLSISMLTVGHIMYVFYFFTFRTDADFGMLIILVLCGVILLALIFFEALRKDGDSLFQELRGELHWDVLSSDKAPKTREQTAIPIRARFILRRFTRAVDLPLVPGRFGPAVYALANILLALVMLTRLHRYA